MNAKKPKLQAKQNLSAKTPILSRLKDNRSTSLSDNTALHTVSRNQSSKRLSLLIEKSKKTLESLQKSEEKLHQFNHQLSSISQSTCSDIGHEFFINLAQSFASVFGVRYVIIGKVTGTAGEKVKTLAFWGGSKIAENFVYDLKGTPCKKVVDNKVCYFPNAIQKHFPDDLFLVENNIESYLGVPIFNTEKQMIGLLSVMDEKPISHYDHYSSILNIFASRCASEMERMNAEAQLESKAQELKKSNQALKDFISLASHDLRGPAGKITLFGERLAEKIDRLEPESKEYLVRIQKSALRMQELIDDLLVFSQTAIQTEPSRKIDLEKVFKEIIIDLGLLPLKNDGQILVDTLPTIEGNLAQVRLLFQNLLSNAIKFHDPDKLQEIKIYSRSCGKNNWEVSVKDHGIGFDEKYKDRIFRPFEKLHGKSEYKGTGMGLAICQKIAENHEGTIKAQSQPGQGACFTVVLPATHYEIEK
jgi:signal transduction histidine kinase